MLHKFIRHNFKNGFETHDSILDIVPYKPEAIFIGTFNHGWQWNKSDFFYGRGMYMWPILGNLFIHGNNNLKQQRTFNNDVPSFHDIIKICHIGSFVFADIVRGIKPSISAIENIGQQNIIVNNEYNWCTRKIKRQSVGQYSDTHLENMAGKDWLDTNVDKIIAYINKTPTIRNVYFTFKSGAWLVSQMNLIKKGIDKNINTCSIFTPTANGFGHKLSPPFQERAWGLTHCWVWNTLDNLIPIDRVGYGHLNHDWLVSKGVDPSKF